MEKSKLLDRCGAEGEDRLLLAKVLDRAAQAEERNIPACTDFLSPQQQMMARDLLRLAGIPETAWLRQGGYQGAERNILLFLPDWMEPETAEPPLRCLRAAFRPDDRLNHRDILGSLMGMGIVREKVGDILVSPESADLIVLDTVADFLLSSWNSAGRAKLTVTEIPAAHLHIPEVRCEEVRDTVSSLRLDAVCSTGFRMARGKAVDMISSGHVQVNWRPCTKADKLLTEGDTVSARGFGKFQLAVVAASRKGQHRHCGEAIYLREEGAACWNTSLKRCPVARSAGFNLRETAAHREVIVRRAADGWRYVGCQCPKASAGLTALSRASTWYSSASGLRPDRRSETWSKSRSTASTSWPGRPRHRRA